MMMMKMTDALTTQTLHKTENQVDPGLLEEELGNAGHDDPKSSGLTHSHSYICEPGHRCFQLKATQSAAGAAMKGVPHTSRLERTIEEVRESARHTWDTENVSHISMQT